MKHQLHFLTTTSSINKNGALRTKGLILLLFILLAGFSANAQFTKLFDFTGTVTGAGTYPGSNPQGDLSSDGTYLYGMTLAGGANGDGTLFQMNMDGTGYSVLRSWGNGSSTNANPYGAILPYNGLLYGMLKYGHSGNGAGKGNGIIFSFKVGGGTPFSNLHDFTPGQNDGGQPVGSLITDDTYFYGMTPIGGSNGDGIIFKCKLDGSGFTRIHTFNSADDNNGASPQGSLLLLNGNLYGMTSNGGANSTGNIFKLNIADTTQYTNLYNFTDGNNEDGIEDGAYPQGSLYSDGTYLYGMAKQGGDHGFGIIFKINTDGTGFTVLHSFNNTDGQNPYGSLVSNGQYLYGMTSLGGNNNDGNIFRIEPDGTGFASLYSFDGTNGATPLGSLFYNSITSTLYGMTSAGGANSVGVMFSFQDNGTALPVQLNNFSGALQNGVANLQWSTGVENNFNHFEIEKSADGSSFQPQGEISFKGNNSHYTFNLPQQEATAYYRLKMADNDGKIAYSKVVTLSQNDNNVLLYPNPAKGYINVTVTKAGSIRIYNAAGSPVKTQVLNTGVNSIDISTLATGIYSADVNGKKVKFLKQ